jgi:hypothetical protein
MNSRGSEAFGSGCNCHLHVYNRTTLRFRWIGRNVLAGKPRRPELAINVECVLARMLLLVGAVLLIASCSGYNYSDVGETEFQRTGQRSMLPDWRKQCDGAQP